jgi:hypothetical protein
MLSPKDKDFGVVILLDALGTRERIIDNVDEFLTDWDLVLKRLEQNVCILEQKLASEGFKTGIKTKDIFDNIQIFYPTDDPQTEYNNFTGSNHIWWSLQHSAELLTNLIRYAITKNIHLRGCISMGYIQEYRNGYYSKSMIENAQLAESSEMVGVIAGPSSMRVLNNKCYSSSPRFYHFVKYRIPVKKPTRKRRKLFDKLAILNLTTNTTNDISMFDSISDKDIENTIQEQIQTHHNNPKVRRKWENTRRFIKYTSNISDEKFFL